MSYSNDHALLAGPFNCDSRVGYSVLRPRRICEQEIKL